MVHNRVELSSATAASPRTLIATSRISKQAAHKAAESVLAGLCLCEHPIVDLLLNPTNGIHRDPAVPGKFTTTFKSPNGGSREARSVTNRPEPQKLQRHGLQALKSRRVGGERNVVFVRCAVCVRGRHARQPGDASFAIHAKPPVETADVRLAVTSDKVDHWATLGKRTQGG